MNGKELLFHRFLDPKVFQVVHAILRETIILMFIIMPFLNGQARAEVTDVTISPQIDIYVDEDEQIIQDEPFSAYDSVNRRFLVAWSERFPEGCDVYGQLVNPDGSLYGSRIPICTTVGHQASPQFVFDPAHQRFLVVWSVSIEGQGWEVDGRLINSDGSLYGGTFRISPFPATGNIWDSFTSVGFDSTLNRFFVLCYQWNVSPTNLYGQFVNVDGSLSGAPVPITDFTSGYGGSGVIGYDSNHVRFLITCGYSEDLVNWRTSGWLLNADGTFYSREFTISDIMMGADGPIPFDSTNNRFLVGLQKPYPYAWGIHEQLVNADGTLYGTPTIVGAYGQGWGNSIFDNSINKFLVTGITPLGAGQLLNSDGGLSGPTFNWVITSHTFRAPFVSFGSGETGSLVIWWGTESSLSITGGIFGRLVRLKAMPLQHLPYLQDFSSDPAWGTSNATNFKWDEETGSYYSKSILNSQEYAMLETDYSGGSFRIEFDIQETIRDPKAMTNFGLFGPTYTSHQGPPYEPCIFVSFDNMFGLVAVTDTGVDSSSSGGVHVEINKWYRIYLSYDSLDKKVRVEVRERDTDNLVWEVELPSLSGSFSTEMRYLGLSMAGEWGYNPGETQEAYIDNLKFLEESTSDLIPPKTTAGISPIPNPAGWNNTDVTITLTASDNEGGSGVKEIHYQLTGAEEETIPGDSVQIPLTTEGIITLTYYAVDNGGNIETEKSLEIKLDKTPPQTTYSIEPLPNGDGWINSLPVKVSFSATDNLSGVAFTTEDKTFTEPGIYPVEYFSTDVAGNIETTKTLTVRVDTTPPTISLELIPLKNQLGLSIDEKIKYPLDRFYKLVYSAADGESGIKEIKAGLVTPDIANFKTKLIKGKHVAIILNEKEKLLIIHAPNPRDILTQLKEGLLSIQNGQPLHLQLMPRIKIWTIVETNKFLAILSPSIIFKVEATDKAGNTSTKELEYKKSK